MINSYAFGGWVTMSCCGGPQGYHAPDCPDAYPPEPVCEGCGIAVAQHGDVCDGCMEAAYWAERSRRDALTGAREGAL